MMGAAMDDDDTWWMMLDNEAQQWEEEHCEHGVHRDSGHWCPECLANRSDEDAV